MKRKYTPPKAIHVDFQYEEQVTATSGNVSIQGDPKEIGRCQQSSPSSCVVFWNSDYAVGVCQMEPFSLR